MPDNGSRIKIHHPNGKVKKMAMAGSGTEELVWSPEKQKFMMILLMLGSTIVYAGRTAMAVCMPAMAEEMSWDKKQQGLILGSFLWGYPCTQIIGGYLADRFGAERVVIFSVGTTSLVTMLTPVFPTFDNIGFGDALALVTFSRVLQGMLQGFFFPATMSWITARVTEKSRTLVYTTMAAGTHLGTMVSGFVGSIILEHANWQTVFYFIGLTGLLWCAYLHKFGDRNHSNIVSMDESFNKSGTASAKPVHSTISWGKVMLNTAFWAMLFAHFAEGYTFFSLLFWMPTYFHEVYPEAEPWMYNSLPWIVDMIVSILAGWLANYMLALGYSKTYTRKLLNIFAEGGFGVALILLSYSGSYFTTLLIICMAATGHGFYQSTIIMNPSDVAPNHSGVMFGVMNTFGAIPGFFGTYISGAILDATKNWNLMWSVAGWCAIAGWAVFAYFGTGEPIIV